MGGAPGGGPPSPPPPPTVEVLAGVEGQAGHADGQPSHALFSFPTGLALSPDGTFLLVCDSKNHCVRRITLSPSAGTATAVSTVAGDPGTSETLDGAVDSEGRSTARFQCPRGICIDGEGRHAYVTDYEGDVVRVIFLEGKGGAACPVATLAGERDKSGREDGPGAAARFRCPAGICIDASSKALLVADAGNNAVRRIALNSLAITLPGGPVRESAGGAAHLFDTSPGQSPELASNLTSPAYTPTAP